jgi:hypothetical protein
MGVPVYPRAPLVVNRRATGARPCAGRCSALHKNRTRTTWPSVGTGDLGSRRGWDSGLVKPGRGCGARWLGKPERHADLRSMPTLEGSPSGPGRAAASNSVDKQLGRRPEMVESRYRRVTNHEATLGGLRSPQVGARPGGSDKSGSGTPSAADPKNRLRRSVSWPVPLTKSS